MLFVFHGSFKSILCLPSSFHTNNRSIMWLPFTERNIWIKETHLKFINGHPFPNVFLRVRISGNVVVPTGLYGKPTMYHTAH